MRIAISGTANTGTCTLNVNGLGAKTIKKDVSTDLATGDILANQVVTVTYDGTNIRLYMDGVIYINTALTCATTTTDLNIGRSTGADQYFNGRMANILCYNRALTQSEILQEYLEGTQDYRGLFDANVGLWDFNNNVLDASGTNNNTNNNFFI